MMAPPETCRGGEILSYRLRRRKPTRPSAASLNSLTEFLRHASPLCAEPRSILNHLDRKELCLCQRRKGSESCYASPKNKGPAGAEILLYFLA